jgi:hypothetical protein
LLFACHNQGFRCGRTLDVNPLRLHAFPNVAHRAVIGDVNAFFAAI